jgi:Spy/CpxP family protein refolding chaperone
MKLSRAAIALYVGLVFVSGAVLGGFAHRLYTVSAVSAKAPSNPEEFRKRVVEGMRTRLNLTEAQVVKLDLIYDETRARVHQTRKQMEPAFEAIRQEQIDMVKAMLTPEQRVEYDKFLKEREEYNKTNRGKGGRPPGF